MSLIWTKHGNYSLADYNNEAELEAAIVQVQRELFGEKRIFLDVKKKLGGKGGIRNIPDGYLIDLTGRQPRVYVVEVELAAHDPLRHIAVQILQFSLSFEAEQRGVKTILFNALQSREDAKAQCEQYVASYGYRNLDHLLENMVYEAPFAALVIIDKTPENLEKVLLEKFRFGVEVLELGKYENRKGERIYCFEPFLADLTADVTGSKLDPSEIDTIVVPAREDGFQETFLGENRWYAIRIHGTMIVVPAREDGFQETFLGENRWYAIRIHGTMQPQIKYIAGYKVAPTSAITHIAPVKSIEPWKDTDKFVVNFSESPQEIGPISLVKGGRVKAPQSIRYTKKERLEAAKTLDEVW